MARAAILLLNARGLETARRIRAIVGEAETWGLGGRVSGTDKSFDDLGQTLLALYRGGATIIGLCASGILIRALAPALADKRGEPPVLAVSDDGAVIVPLLGGLTGANELALALAAGLSGSAAITASGARAFRLQLEAPPEGYVLANPEDAKRVTAELLAGATARLEGSAPWLEESGLPFAADGEIALKVSARAGAPPAGGLLFHPRAAAITLADPERFDGTAIIDALERRGLAPASIAAVVMAHGCDIASSLMAAARALGAEVRIALPGEDLDAAIARAGGDVERLGDDDGIGIHLSATPLAAQRIGRAVGRLSIIGLGPGDAASLTHAAMAALEAADDLVGYATYLDLVPPLAGGKRRHASGNRVELERAREALGLAAEGRRVALVSSGDPGIFAMAGAVMEALEAEPGRWTGLEVDVVPGVSAMQTAAARIGAPLGHDFSVISLSDIRKPWEVIAARLEAVGSGDFVVALYNPASKSRRDQIERARDILLRHRPPETPVIVGRNLGRQGEETEVVALARLESAMVDMRTILIIGSSRSRTFRGPGGRLFAYTPRSHEDP